MNGKYINSIILREEIDEDSYPFNLPAIKYLIENEEIPLTSDVTFFIGENGSGKSTLLEAVAVAYGFNPEGGSKNFNFETSNTHSDLYKYLTLSKTAFAKDGFFLRAESFYNVATSIDDLDEGTSTLLQSYGGISMHEQSHGESFLALVQNRFRGNGLYILDEPEAALSPTKLMSLIVEINRLIRNNSQLIIATHSPILMSFPNAQIYQIDGDGIESVSYKDTEHYQLTKLFLDDPERMLNQLLTD